MLAYLIYAKVKLDYYDIEAKHKSVEIKNSYGVDIHYQYSPESFFPHDRTPRGSQAWIKHIGTTLPLVKRFLSRYPDWVIKENLADIFLLGKLEINGRSYGGTYVDSAIYISLGGFFRHNDSSLLGLMHSEFSSILFRQYKFFKEAWKAVNSPTWSYEDSDRGTGFEMLGKKDLHEQTGELLRNGFLVKFSQSDLENDFNMFVSWAFTRPDRLRELASKYERIQKKYRLVIEFYESIDPRIDIPRM